MVSSRFGRLIRFAPDVSSRRAVLRALAGVSGFTAVHAPELRGANDTGKRKGKTRLKRNQFGCVNVGGTCRGRDAACCSGVCDGKKPSKGARDRSRCVSHHQGICTPADRACADGPTTPCNPERVTAHCFRTTGHAGFCGDDVIPGCIPCRKDADCQQQAGQGAACVVCSGCPGGATCLPPGID